MKKKIRRLNQSVDGVMRGNNLSHFASCFFITALFLAQPSYAADEANTKPIFKLIKGQGIEVCEAYLKRLNATDFLDNDPTKGRINEPLLKGFSDLKPVSLTAEEIQRIYTKIISFDRYQDQHILDRDMEIKINTGTDRKEDYDEGLKERVAMAMNGEQNAPFVRYQTLLDMDNDSIADDIIIKNNNSVYIMDEKLQRINEQRMKTIFGDQELLAWATIRIFPPLVAPIHVFSYNHKFYFDGFTDLMMSESQFTVGINKTNKIILAVFIYEKHTQRKVCEYQWINNNSGENYTQRKYYD